MAEGGADKRRNRGGRGEVWAVLSKPFSTSRVTATSTSDWQKSDRGGDGFVKLMAMVSAWTGLSWNLHGLN
jgi:hypothetical protein